MTASKDAIAEWRSFWFLPIAAALGYSTSVLHVYSIGPFMQPLQEELGWSRAQISIGITVASIISALFCIPIGMLVDRVGPRRVGLLGVPVMSASFALLSTTTGTQANWIALWVVIALGTLCVQATVWTSAVSTRFTASRGLAFAITLSGGSLSAAAFPMLATWLIQNHGWRSAFAGMGVIWAALVFPVLLLCFRGAQDTKHKQLGRTTAPATTNPEGVTLSQGLRSPVLYKLLIASALFSFTVIGAVVHFVPILTDRGATPLRAASMASLVGIFSIAGRLGTGVLLDKLPAHLVGAVAFLLPIVGAFALLADGANPLSQGVAASVLGLTVGSEVDVIAYLAARHFGLKSFGALYGALVMALSLGTAFGPLVAGAIFDHYASYAPFLQLMILLMAISAATLFSLASTHHSGEAVPQSS
jgi:MFS family permease